MRTRKKEGQRKRFIGLLFLIVLFISFIVCSKLECHYNIQGFVVEQEADVLTVEDRVGTRWHYVTREAFTEKEEVKIYLYTNLTDSTREDDKVIKIKRIKKT